MTQEVISIEEEFETIKKKKYKNKRPFLFNKERIIFFKNNVGEIEEFLQHLIVTTKMCGYTATLEPFSRGHSWKVRNKICSIEFRPQGVEYDKNACYFDKGVFTIFLWLDNKNVVECIDLTSDTYRGLSYTGKHIENAEELSDIIHKHRVFIVRENSREEMEQEVNELKRKMQLKIKELSLLLPEFSIIKNRSIVVKTEENDVELEKMKSNIEKAIKSLQS